MNKHFREAWTKSIVKRRRWSKRSVRRRGHTRRRLLIKRREQESLQGLVKPKRRMRHAT